MAAMKMVSAGGFSVVSFHLRRCPQGAASVLCKKTPIFGSLQSKLDNLTVRCGILYFKYLQTLQVHPGRISLNRKTQLTVTSIKT
jgi:hypothetical protein